MTDLLSKTHVNHYIEEPTFKKITTANFEEIGIAGSGAINDVLKGLNAEGWNNLMVTDESTKRLMAKFEKAEYQLGRQGLYSPLASGASLAISEFRSAAVKSTQSVGASFRYQTNIKYKRNGED